MNKYSPDFFYDYYKIENLMAFSDSEETFHEKFSELAIYIKNIHVDQNVINDLPLFQRIGQIGVPFLHDACERLELKALLQGDDPKKGFEWLLKNKTEVFLENPSDFFDDLSALREQLISAGLLEPEVGTALSTLITNSFGLKGQKDARAAKSAIVSILEKSPLAGVANWIFKFKLQPNELKALAHWINTEKISLKDTHLSESELKAIAPYLQYVDCRGLSHQKTLIESCCNAYHIIIYTNEITELRELPVHLTSLDCNRCLGLKHLDLKNSLKLQHVDCSYCPIETLDVSHNKALETLDISKCPISVLDLSHNKHLKELQFNNCPKLISLDLKHNPQLQTLKCEASRITDLDLSENLQLQTVDCNVCQDLTHLNLSHNRQLQTLRFSFCKFSTIDLSNNRLLRTLDFGSCHNLRDIDLSQNTELQTIFCNHCTILTSLGASLSNTLERLECEFCLFLRELPQLPSTTIVYSSYSLCGNLNSFKVYPTVLEKNPKQVLLNLGKILLQNRPFPNIVYMDEATGKPNLGIDAGGLRRQFVATLCENLFKEGSNFTFIKDEGYDIPTSSDKDALRTFARLLGLAAVSTMPTGTNLHPSFFHALFALSDKELSENPLSESSIKKLYSARHGFLDLEDMEKESNNLAAIALVAGELVTLLGKKLRQFKIDEFITKVQGSKVTKESLKQNISCNNSQYQEWINSFIDKLKIDQLKYFLMLLTGSTALSEGKIAFEVYEARKYCQSATVIHTCSKTMDLPGDLNEGMLHEELMAQISLLKIFNSA